MGVNVAEPTGRKRSLLSYMFRQETLPVGGSDDKVHFEVLEPPDDVEPVVTADCSKDVTTEDKEFEKLEKLRKHNERIATYLSEQNALKRQIIQSAMQKEEARKAFLNDFLKATDLKEENEHLEKSLQDRFYELTEIPEEPSAFGNIKSGVNSVVDVYLFIKTQIFPYTFDFVTAGLMSCLLLSILTEVPILSVITTPFYEKVRLTSWRLFMRMSWHLPWIILIILFSHIKYDPSYLRYLMFAYPKMWTKKAIKQNKHLAAILDLPMSTPSPHIIIHNKYEPPAANPPTGTGNPPTGTGNPPTVAAATRRLQEIDGESRKKTAFAVTRSTVPHGSKKGRQSPSLMSFKMARTEENMPFNHKFENNVAINVAGRVFKDGTPSVTFGSVNLEGQSSHGSSYTSREDFHQLGCGMLVGFTFVGLVVFAMLARFTFKGRRSHRWQNEA